MAVAPGVKPVTAEDFEQLDPEWRYDLIEGELVPMPPPPGADHGAVTADITADVIGYVRSHGLGRCFVAETRFIIERGPDTTLGPDLAFVSRERLPRPLPSSFLALAPDLVLEVRSPSDRAPQVAGKVERWLRAGVRLVWELDLKTRTLTVHRPGRPPRQVGIDEDVEGGSVLPGFRLPMRGLFPE